MASTKLATFVPNDLSMVITQVATGLQHTMSGFAEDTLIEIARQSDTFEMYTGGDDTPTRIRKSNSSMKVTCSLQQTSNSNDILSMLYQNDKATNDGMFEILIKDNSGRSTYYSAEAYIARVPDTSYANSMQIFKWVIDCPRSDVYIGGNAKFTPEDAASMGQLGANLDPRWV